MGYLAGVLDGIFASSAATHVCLPTNKSGTEYGQEIVAMLRIYEGDLTALNPADLVLQVYAKMYGC